MSEALVRVLLLAITALLAPTLLAQASRVDQKFGFRDLSFGEPLDARQFTLNSRSNPTGIEQYIRRQENLRLGQATLSRITYVTVAGKLARVKIQSAQNGDDAYKLIAVAKESYGEPDKTSDAGKGTIVYFWYGTRVSAIAFRHDSLDGQQAALFLADIAQAEYVLQHLKELDRSGEL